MTLTTSSPLTTWATAVRAKYPAIVVRESSGAFLASTRVDTTTCVVGGYNPRTKEGFVAETALSAPFERAGLDVRVSPTGEEFTVHLRSEHDAEQFHRVVAVVRAETGFGEVEYDWKDDDQGVVTATFKIAPLPETGPTDQNDAKEHTKFTESMVSTNSHAELDDKLQLLWPDAQSVPTGNGILQYVLPNGTVVGYWDVESAQGAFKSHEGDSTSLESGGVGYRVYFVKGGYAAYEGAASEEEARAMAARQHPAEEIDRVERYALKRPRRAEALLADKHYFVSEKGAVLGGPFDDEDAAYSWQMSQDDFMQYAEVQLQLGQDVRLLDEESPRARLQAMGYSVIDMAKEYGDEFAGKWRWVLYDEDGFQVDEMDPMANSESEAWAAAEQHAA